MFTGLVEEIGVVSELNTNDETGGTSLIITVPETSQLLADACLGDSIAVNGVCLTATALEPMSFKVGVAPETLRITNLGSLQQNNKVNLERAVRADTRMGGHFVQGHVDTVAEITKIEQDGNALTFRFKPREREFMRYVVYKGFIALDGTSLTITNVDDDEGWWEIMLIVYTQERVVIAQKKVGETVNVEVDILAKYAEKSMTGYLSQQLEGEVRQDTAAELLLEKIVERIVNKKLSR